MNKRFSVLGFIVAVITVFYSCKNNDEVFAKKVTTGLNIVNASVDTLNFFLNGSRLNSTSSLYPLGQTFYLPVPSGTQNYQFKKAGTSVILFSLPENLADSINTTIYVYGSSASETLTTKDNLLTLTAHPDTTQVRFVNVSPDAGTLNVAVGDTVSFNSAAFKSSSAFAYMTNGVKEIKIYQTGTTTLLKDTSIIFQPGYTYTVYSKGLLKGTGNATFNIGVAINVE
jgi:Domain of unknown function (DUF4397)